RRELAADRLLGMDLQHHALANRAHSLDGSNRFDVQRIDLRDLHDRLVLDRFGGGGVHANDDARYGAPDRAQLEIRFRALELEARDALLFVRLIERELLDDEIGLGLVEQTRCDGLRAGEIAYARELLARVLDARFVRRYRRRGLRLHARERHARLLDSSFELCDDLSLLDPVATIDAD